MRQYCLCLFIGLLAAAFLQSSVMCQSANLPDECCFTYYDRKIPIARTESYIVTRVECTKPGVIIITKRGSRLCVDPQLNWVKSAMQAVDDRVF
ncbi:C-C motif chemokine 8-like [Carassius gibelio]|uniref:C-C motif chemokine 8-like n=1 Tax=Carassius gibelio TaxID=101364 RepID=UPI002278752A|nr:C-C motif chemokine 8-like [Carassius gibelio]